MIRSRNAEFGLPGGIPDTAGSEYLRAKLEERSGAMNHRASASFTKRGNDVWAERSGRTYYSDGAALEGGAMDFASPPAGNGKLSNLTGGASKKGLPRGVVYGLVQAAKETAKLKKGGSNDSYEVANLMSKGAQKNAGHTAHVVSGDGKPKRKNGRAAMVGKIMKERGVSLPEASKIVKAEGLY